MAIEAKEGWYWVRRPNGNVPFVARWDGDSWWDDGYRNDLIVLSDRLIPPQETQEGKP